MTSTELNLIAPLNSPLPPPPEGEVLTSAQWCTLMAIADTLIPAVEVSTIPSKTKLALPASEYTSAVDQIKNLMPAVGDLNAPQDYLWENASATPGFREWLHRQFGHYVREDALKGIRIFLTALK